MDSSKNNKVHIELIKRLELYEPSTFQFQSTSSITCKSLNGDFNCGKFISDNFCSDYFNHFPLIINPDGSLWVEANRYLLSRLISVVPVKYRTLESVATDLAHFRQWLVNENIEFLNITPRPRSRPTYRYCAYLHDEIRLQKLKSSTAKRRMSTVLGFYRWLIEDGYEFEFPLWVENEAKFFFKNAKGFQRTSSYTSTDLTRTFKTNKNSNDYTDRIEDGGQLRPLPKDEQIELMGALKRIGNIEMLLSFIFALTTGARLQTVFTLRQINFSQNISEHLQYYRLKVGTGTLVNTKNGKQMVLLVPAWLYKKFQVYLKSERYLGRLKRSVLKQQNNENYVFLTKVGKPYYLASQDDDVTSYGSPPRGNAITQFIRQQLIPDLTANRKDFEFSFHDLRATFGMNLLEGKLCNYKLGGIAIANQPEFFQLLMYVKERMGHSQLSTTEAYLNYRQKYNLALHVQSDYELYLEKLIS